MSELNSESVSNAEREHDAQRGQIADMQDKLDADAEADGDGLAAEAGSGEETGLAEG